MIKHIVIWRLLDTAEGQSKADNLEKATHMLEGLNGKIPGLIKLEMGKDISRGDFSGDLVLYSELESPEALKAYQTHPLHVEAAQFVSAICSERIVVDYEA